MVCTCTAAQRARDAELEYIPGRTMDQAQAYTAAWMGLPWPEQESLPARLRIDLWALVQGKPEDERTRTVKAFRQAHDEDVRLFRERRSTERVARGAGAT